MIPKHGRMVKKLADLKPHPENAKERRITPDAHSGLRACLTTFGEVQNIVWNKRSGCIVGGHERVEILMSEGEVDVDVTVVDLEPDDETILRAALNNQAITGRFTDVVGQVMEQLSESREALIRELRLDSLVPKEAEDVQVTHIATSTVADRFLITVAGDIPKQASVLQVLAKALRDIPEVEVNIVLNKRG